MKKRVLSMSFFLLLTLFDNLLTTVRASETKPQIIFAKIAAVWANVSTGSNSVFYSTTGSDLFVNCKAPYPIQWNISGLIAPADIVKMQPPRRNLHENIFEIRTNYFFIDARNYHGLAASAKVACQKINDHSVSDHFSVFVRGNNPFVEPSTKVVTDSKLIPCPTTDPTSSTTLYLKAPNGVEETVQNATYDPTEGFRSDKVFNGVYECRKQSSSISITANTTSDPNSDHQFSPLINQIRVFTDESIELTCSSKIKSVMLVVDENSNASLQYSVNTDKIRTATLSVPENSRKTNIKGKVACITSENKEVIKEWFYEFVEAPELYLDNFEGEVDCLSPLFPKMVQTVRCRDRMDCNFMDHCFRNETLCNFKKQKQFFAATNTNCWIEKLDDVESCASVPYSHLNGIAQCTVLGLAKKYEFFTSLDFLRYSNWKDASESELLRMDEVSEILYTNESTKFFCLGSAFLFADSLSFGIELKNDTGYILQDNKRTVNISNPGSKNLRKIDEFNVLGILDIKLPLDAVAIHCIAPWWNSTDVMKTSRKFETRHLLSPIVPYSDEIEKKSFYIGQTNRRLECFAEGEPQPVYQWLVKTDEKSGFVEVSEEFPTIVTSVSSNGTSYLEFPKVDEKYSVHFKCRATNIVGTASRTFQLDVTDEPLSSRVAIYISIVAAILFLLVTVSVALMVLIRRYSKAKALIRSLTDTEIKEFFQGRPELVANKETSIDTVNFMPYNAEFEIPTNDISFDTSEASFLGSGEFAYVVRGTIISKSKSAAVKISKPSADVNIFKSLLSEVKIMTYIGHHENVITLVGVCTQDIRNRAIYIVTEICELGSLGDYLRKGRETFVNIINVNQEIDRSLIPEDRDITLSTLDLISFSAQIACGMEYLASKSVIHADLAARNVLLTPGKICKISDFGLSKKMYGSNNYTKKSKNNAFDVPMTLCLNFKCPLPWRWMAIESLNTLTFSTQSDVWSYGVTLYEIFSLGDTAFPNEVWDKQFLMRLESGMRMGRPKFSTHEIFSKILTCWENEPELRPTFSTLRCLFQEMFKDLQRDNILVKKDGTENPVYSNIPDTSVNMTLNASFKERYVNLVL